VVTTPTSGGGGLAPPPPAPGAAPAGWPEGQAHNKLLSTPTQLNLAKRIKNTAPEWAAAVLYEGSVKRVVEVKLGVMWRLADMQKLSIKNSGQNSVWEGQEDPQGERRVHSETLFLV
jgi:hypothetical protein